MDEILVTPSRDTERVHAGPRYRLSCVREANQHFSKAIRAVRAGKEVILTERGQPIAVIIAAHPLQAFDAIHVASAKLFATRVASPTFTFVSADIQQTTAAAALGINTRDIES